MNGDYEHPQHVDQSWIGPAVVAVVVIVLIAIFGLRYLFT